MSHMAEPVRPPAEGSEIELPAVFGRYLLLRRMSRGGMGEIFLAKSGEVQGFEKLFVIKKILPALSSNEEFSDRFADEAKITINLKHANIVPVFEVGMVDGDFFLTMEYVEGRDLRRILSRCYECGIAVPPDLALLIARDIANGLSYAHRRKDESGVPLDLVHCDISPPNVLVSLEGEVRIIDFGVSRSADQISGVDSAVGFGKFGYMAPEQILKGRELDNRTDLYALGVVLYEMLVGDRMIEFGEHEEYREIARRVVLGHVPPPSERRPELGRRFDDLVMRAIAKEPENRFQTAADLRDEIQRHLLELNPTISQDGLAEFLEHYFGPELVQEREMVRDLKAADHSQFVLALNEQREKTVSYAMTDIWSVSAGAMGAVGGPLGAAPMGSSVEETASLSKRWGRRTWVVWLGLAALLLGVGILVLALRSRDRGEAERTGSHASATGAKAGMSGPGPVMLRRVSPRPDAGILELPPVVVRRAPSSPRARVWRWRPRRGWRPMVRRPTRPRLPPASGDLAEKRRVLAKYRRVRRQYLRFKAKYGERLERHWIRIARTAVYSGAGRYKQLDRLLDGLSARMARARRSEP